MIRDGSIAYTHASSPLLLWEPQHPLLNTLLIGFLTTVLSFQAVSLVFDLLLGLKPSSQATLSDLHSLLLVRSCSPLAVLNNVIRKNWLTRRYYNGDIPSGTKIRRSQTKMEWKVLAKLLLLFAAGPVINMAAVAATLETEKYITFRNSGFGGLGWGVNTDLKVAESHQITETCQRYGIRTHSQDVALVQFASCNRPFTFEVNKKFTGSGVVSVGVENQSDIFILVVLHGWLVNVLTIPQLYANGTLFRVKHALSKATAAALVDKGIELLAVECALQDMEGTVLANDASDPSLLHIHSKEFPCKSDGQLSEDEVQEKLQFVAGRLRDYVTFVNTDRLGLYPEPEEDQNEIEISLINSILVENIVFLKRRKRNWSVPIIGLVCASLITIRILTISFLNNDVAVAIELAVKKRMGMSFHESMLKNENGSVSYNNKLQKGERAHYGLMRYDLPIVDRFEGGTVGKDIDE